MKRVELIFQQTYTDRYKSERRKTDDLPFCYSLTSLCEGEDINSGEIDCQILYYR